MGNPAEKWFEYITLECCLCKQGKGGDFRFSPSASLTSLAYDPDVRYISSKERRTDESLRRNIIMAKFAR